MAKDYHQTIFINDNLPVLRGLNSQSVDLIYLDPPFNSKRLYEAPIGSPAEGAKFEDTWTLTDIDHEEFELLRQLGDLGGKVRAVAAAGWQAHGDSMISYLLFMAPRLIECHRVLKDTGSLYLHCDPTASHYLKLLLDAIFGPPLFRNEIIWGYEKPRSASKRFRQNHDTIFFYAKTPQAGFNEIRVPLLDGSFVMRKPFKRPDGSVWRPKKPGKQAGSWWYDIPSFATRMTAKERTGYPTQKPLKLLQRIIEASSNPGDFVLDPFAGCATTCVAAYQLERQWAGIDISPKAGELVKSRIADIGQLFGQIAVRTDLPKRTDLPGDPILTATGKRKLRPILHTKQKGKCAGCEIKTRLELMELDRIIPGSNGGEYRASNCQLLCGNCNRRKGAKTQTQFLAELRRYQTQLINPQL